MKIAVLFPGQGSQYLGMGRSFIDSSPECATVMNIAESVCDFPLGALCLNGPMEELTRAAVLQPAITVTNLICLQALQSALPAGVTISGYAGHSLGEYSALCAAGVVSVEDTIKLVERRGFFMEREGRTHPGVMQAVLGLLIEEVEAVVAGYKGSGVVAVANYNTDRQIVIAGTTEAIDEVGVELKSAGGKLIPLNVSVANHSPLVAEAVPDFSEFMGQVTFKAPRVPVYFNVTAAVEDDPARIKEMMARQIVSRVRWFELITRMIDDGFDTFIEVGPKTVLTSMMRKIVPKGQKIVALQCDTPESLRECLAGLATA